MSEPKECSVELNCEGGIWECQKHDLEQKIDELEIEIHDLKNTSPVATLRALREVDQMKLDSADIMLEKLAWYLEDTKQYVNENTERTLNQALKEYEEWKNK